MTLLDLQGMELPRSSATQQSMLSVLSAECGVEQSNLSLVLCH
jgi:hypothetical protein